MKHSHKAFTIIELLVVVSIIALLVGILLPAIGKAQDQARLTRSQANLKQLGTAAVTYSAEWADRQLTYINDNMARYGDNWADAVSNYHTQNGVEHPWIYLGFAQGVVWGYSPELSSSAPEVFVPMNFSTRFGAFRLPNSRNFSQYLNGRFYDPVFFAPKDTAVMASVEQAMEMADEFSPLPVPYRIKWSSYCFSPAAMFNPMVFGRNGSNGYWNDPWQFDSGFKSPSMSQATFPDLKSHMIEHHWLQGRKKVCNPNFTDGPYDGCQPYFFNHAFNSQPVTLFYDGHIESMGQEDCVDSNFRIVTQSGQSNGGLWSLNTPAGPNPNSGGSYGDFMGGAYFMEVGLDWSSTSYHTMTIDGIRGRDITPK